MGHTLRYGLRPQTLTFYRLPRQHHKNLKSTNLLATDNQRVQQQVAKAVEWLETETCVTTDDLAGRLYGLFWANRNEREIRAAAAQLLREQRSDGSWAQK